MTVTKLIFVSFLVRGLSSEVNLHVGGLRVHVYAVTSEEPLSGVFPLVSELRTAYESPDEPRICKRGRHV